MIKMPLKEIWVRIVFYKTRPSAKRSELRELSNLMTDENTIIGTFKLIVNIINLFAVTDIIYTKYFNEINFVHNRGSYSPECRGVEKSPLRNVK